MLAKLGHEVVDPFLLTDQTLVKRVIDMPYGPEKRDAWRELNTEIARNNQHAIDTCDALFAVLDGADVDSGTAAEIGYGFAQGKLIVGYRGDFRITGDNEGCVVNLQVEFFIRQSGGDIVGTIDHIPGALERIATVRASNKS
jgi:nucleoside 2-deoxyribosyltransferase